MNSHFTIAISRQYGSGGRGIARALAESLGIGCYDKELITLTAERSGLSEGFIESSEENATGSFIANLGFNAYNGLDSVTFYDTPTTDKMFLAQSSVIRELAAQGPCVILGRCADYVLRDQKSLIRVFIRADREDRVRRAIEEYELPRKNAEAYVKKTDKSRSNYYKFYANRAWNDPEHIDLLINSSLTGEIGAVELIRTFLRVRGLI